MKRVALRRRQAPGRKTPLRQKSEIRRKTATAKRNPARLARTRAVQYGPAGYGDWLRSLACVVTGCRDERIECAHVRSRGAGGDWTSTVPMCRTHHSSLHALGTLTFQRRHGLDLSDLASVHQLRWRAFAGGQGDTEPLVSEQEPTQRGIVSHPGVQNDAQGLADVLHSSNLR